MIGVVIVTYNRCEKLRIALQAFDSQTVAPDYVLVVDNKSTDGTCDYLAQWSLEEAPYAKYVVLSEANLGGSGGFHKGFDNAMTLDSDWIWVSDDDAYPQQDAIEIAERFLRECAQDPRAVSAICGKVLKNGVIDTWHRRTIVLRGTKVVDTRLPESSYLQDSFDVDELTYVGSIISKQALEKVGLTLKDYFIYEDDAEHSLRIGQAGRIVCVPSIVINHDAPEECYRYTWKTYYSERNRIDMIRRHFPESVYRAEYRRRKLRAIARAIARRDTKVWKLFNDALNDAKRGKLGLHDVYKPGWHLDYRYDSAE